jgi:proteic killer suppression protein
MKIVSMKHKGLEGLWRDDETRGLPADQVKRLSAALALLSAVAHLHALATIPGWRLHELKGRRKGTWSMSVTRIWRLTFRVEGVSIYDVDLEEYH